MSIPWEVQQKNDIKWYKGHINKNIALNIHADYFTYIYKLYCSSIHAKQFKNALEIGISDTGGYLSIMPNIVKRIGFDPAVDLLKEMDMLPLADKISYVRGYAEQLPFGDNSFDLIIMSNALDHVRNIEETMAEVDRVLAPSGHILFATFLKVKRPHPWTWQSGEEARQLFKKYEVVEQHDIKDERPFFHRNDAYVAIFKK